MKTSILMCLIGLTLAACDSPKPTQTTTQDTAKMSMADSPKIKKDTMR